MRSLILTVLALFAASAVAQDWALLNPAYKYNYSLGGTDTITNQIFITEIDTLGPDSLLYQLNRIGVPCDTCPATLGGPCDGCFVWADQPQFLKRTITVAHEQWSFSNPGQLIIVPAAPVGAAWLAEPDSGVTASVDSVTLSTVYGQPDSIKFISLSNGSTIVTSRSFGILRFDAPGAEFIGIGVHGPDVGELIPEPLSYFDLPIGAAINIQDHHFFSGGGFPPLIDCSGMHSFSIVSKTTMPLGFTYGITCTGTPGCTSVYPTCPSSTWSVTLPDALNAHGLLASYPGQLVNFTDACFGSQALVIAQHGIGPDGYRTLSASLLAADSANQNANCGFYSSPISLFDTWEVLPGLYATQQFACGGLHYREGHGIDEMAVSFFEYSCEMFAGVLILGDQSRGQLTYSARPNPASEEIHFDVGMRSYQKVSLLTSVGNVARAWSGNFTGTCSFDLTGLTCGSYSLILTSQVERASVRVVILR